MKKKIYLVTLFMSTITFSQVGIGTNTPSTKSILDLTATDKGLLLPRMTTAQREAINPTATIDKGLAVFDTTTTSIWFWTGTEWINTLNTTNASDASWGLTGNSGTNPASNYLGTADANDFSVKANNSELLRFASTGNLGVNTSSPNDKALVDFNGTTVGSKGVKLPYMSTATRNALGLADVLPGMQMYNVTTQCVEVFINSTKGWYNPCDNTFSNLQPASVSSFTCASITKTGTYYTGSSVNGLGYTMTIPYTGGNGGVFSAQTFYSTGVTGLVATLNAGTIQSGSGNLVLTMSGTPSAVGTATFNLNIFGQTCNPTITVLSGGTISGTLTAGSPSFTSVLNSPSTTQAFAGYPVAGGAANLTYTGPASGPYNGASFTSTGVLGLTATFTSGTLNAAGGTIPVTITGTPDRVGTASFAITIGGKSTILTVPVTAFVSCNDYKTKNTAAGFSGFTDGVYKIDPDLAAGSTALIDCQCDMTTDGGGWTLVLNYLHQGGTNPAESAQTNKLPLLGATTLGTDESSNTTYWGHAAPSLMNLFNFTTVRFYGKTSNHARIIHFKPTEPDMINYFKSGGGQVNVNNLKSATYTTSLAGHTANIPYTANTGFGGQGTNAMLRFPFYENGVAHWKTGNNDNRWEVDDFPNNFANSTYHAIWIR